MLENGRFLTPRNFQLIPNVELSPLFSLGVKDDRQLGFLLPKRR